MGSAQLCVCVRSLHATDPVASVWLFLPVWSPGLVLAGPKILIHSFRLTLARVGFRSLQVRSLSDLTIQVQPLLDGGSRSPASMVVFMGWGAEGACIPPRAYWTDTERVRGRPGDTQMTVRDVAYQVALVRRQLSRIIHETVTGSLV